MQEEWRPVVGIHNYEVSSHGRIRNVTTEYVLRQNTSKGGYKCVTLYYKAKTIHSLVAAAFLGPRPDGYDVNHIDGVKSNNTVSNLEYLDKTEHMRHSIRLGLNDPRPKLSPEDIPAIREMIKQHSYGAVGKRYGVSPGTIWDVVRRKTWAHIA